VPSWVLRVGLTAIVQLAQQQADQLLAHLEALLAQRHGDVALAAADPAQRRLRIATDGALDQLFERRQQARLTFDRALATTAAPPHTLTQRVAASPQLGNAAIDRAARDPRRRRNRRHPATAQRQRLVGRKQSTSPFVQKTGDPAIACPKRFDINHRHKISKASIRCINILILFLRSFPHSDSIVSHRVLSRRSANYQPPAAGGLIVTSGINVSIHAPARGATCRSWCRSPASSGFDPRPRARGHAAAAPPSRVMNSRLLMSKMELPPGLLPRGDEGVGSRSYTPTHDSTSQLRGRPLHCGISIQLMSQMGQTEKSR
jgi:hypothetical protein